jgi:hypothetical protein
MLTPCGVKVSCEKPKKKKKKKPKGKKHTHSEKPTMITTKKVVEERGRLCVGRDPWTGWGWLAFG